MPAAGDGATAVCALDARQYLGSANGDGRRDAGSALLDGREAGAPIAATLTKHEAAAQVVGLVVGEMRRLVTETVPAAELSARRQFLAGNDGRAVETTEGIADAVGNAVLQSISMKNLSRSPAAIAQVDAAAVRAAAKRWFDPSGASIVVVGDTKQFAEALRAVYPGLEVFSAADLTLDGAALR